MNLPPELALLLLLSTPTLTSEEVAQVQALLETTKGEFDWGLFVDRATRHRVLPLVSSHLLRAQLTRSSDGSSNMPYRSLFAYAYGGSTTRNTLLCTEYGRVMAAMTAAGIRYAVRKGPAVLERLYGDVALRQMQDLDLLIDRADHAAFAAVLTSLGYEEGKPNSERTRIVPYDRRTRVFWRTQLTIGLSYALLSGQFDPDTYRVEPCFHLTQKQSAAKIDTAQVLARAQARTICGAPSFALEPVDELIDVCAHAHKEGTSLYFIETGNDLAIKKFLDIALSTAALSDAERADLIGRVVECGAQTEVYWGLWFASRLYPTRVPDDLLSAVQPNDLDYLERFGDRDGKPQQWPVPFIERLFAPDRSRMSVAVSTVPNAHPNRRQTD